MFLVCGKITHLCRLHFSWYYTQDFHTFRYEKPGGMNFVLHWLLFVTVYPGSLLKRVIPNVLYADLCRHT